jgi:hypothetical protein
MEEDRRYCSEEFLQDLSSLGALRMKKESEHVIVGVL